MHGIHPPQPTIVLLHSSASSARQWDRLAEMLTPQFRVHAIELHGHGEQAGWRGDAPMSLADEAALAVPVLEEAGAVHVVGHSYGGAVALKLATMYPQAVRSVAVYEPVLFRFLLDDNVHHSAAQAVVAVAHSMREQLAAGHNHSAAQIFINYWSGAGAWDSLPDSKQAPIAARMGAVVQHFDALFHEPLSRAQLRLLRMPTLFISGAKTVPVARALVEFLRVTLPWAKHEVLPAMGHMGPITHAAQVNQRLVEFLQYVIPTAVSNSFQSSTKPMRELSIALR